MLNFEQLICEEIQGYQGPHQELVACTPFMYRLLTRVLDDPELPGRLRPLVLVAIAYFMLPVDTISEDLTGPRGYLDDLYFAAMVADTIQRDLGSEDLLVRNWEGKGAFFPLIENILRQEKELIGDQKDVMLWYTGFEHLI